MIHYKWLRFANNNLLNALMVCLDVTTWKYIVAAILLDSRELCLPSAVSCFICFSSATFEIQSSASYATSSLWLDCAKDNQLVVTELTKKQRLNRRYKPGRHTLPKCLTPLPKTIANESWPLFADSVLYCWYRSFMVFISFCITYCDQEYGDSIANALVLLLSYTKPSIWPLSHLCSCYSELHGIQ